MSADRGDAGSSALRAWRARSGDEQLAYFESLRPKATAVDPAARDRVLACPDRGPEGGLKLLDAEKRCCGGGPELTSCAASKGTRPGRVTLRDCLSCKA